MVDIVIIGSGIAGLSLALKTAEQFPDKKILILTKANEGDSNTQYAQGGIAVVTDFGKDTFEKHIEDTLIAGDGLCNKKVVEIVIREGRQRVDELINWGTKFDKSDEGNYKLGKEGGHSEFRVLHHKDITGWEIERALLDKVHQTKNIEISQHHFVIDLLTQHHLGRIITRVTEDIQCYGVYVLNLMTNQIEKIESKIVVLATGGFGQIYRATTNPNIATGDGIAMVYRAKGRVANLEFVQFHPTALYEPGVSPNFLITEAVRGDGAILRTKNGSDLMANYDKRGSLAPRDIVARAIDNEMKKSGEDHMYLDCRHMDKENFLHHFPNIYEKCKSIGIDVFKDMIPVVPAAHYACGGINVDEYGRTSIKNLYACGECSNTGLHGANRLASNSLLEAIVFSHRIFEDICQQLPSIEMPEAQFPQWNADGTSDPNEMVIITQSIKELKDIMSSYVGIVRNNIRLKRAQERLYLLFKDTEELYETTTISPQLLELRNMITIGYLVTRSAKLRKESRGLHYTTDYPNHATVAEETRL
ncbi:MAG TPA: L-aspartate oxidase [Chitinophagales bacterium]|jgi:L-aspartate oxidase|nr:L-aspartate oxidase [Chitinophagales bacterium]MBP6154246.1 L-aspartate oxidase [Chitinophagales bacterium]HQV78288.1 L-aspartate oxidase [Chitinophagales bacterium]HQW79439.1 L-aspartate oxidase [Chitinophagales bacterium]HRB19878.1 L-aspartate oxidase [Chitinophagales bacterium]